MVSNTGVADVYWAHYGPHRFTVWRDSTIKRVIIPFPFKVVELKSFLTSLYRNSQVSGWILIILRLSLHLLNPYSTVSTFTSVSVCLVPPNLLSAQSDLTCSKQNQLHLFLCTVDWVPVLHVVIILPTEPAGPFTFSFFTLSISFLYWLMFTWGGGNRNVYSTTRCQVFRGIP